MAEIVDFGLQKHKIKMDSRYFDNVLSVVAGDTGRRIEVQLLDTNGMVQNTTGLNLRLNAEIAGKATFTDATLVDATTGKYQLDLSNGMFLAPGNWQFQWQITDSVGKKLHSFAFTGNVGKNISEGGAEATNFYLNLDDLKAMQEDLINGSFDSEVLETNIAEKLTNLESEYAPKLTEVTAQLAQKVDEGQVKVSDINKNYGLLDESYISDTLKAQIAGTTSIGSTPPDKSVTTKKATFFETGKNKVDNSKFAQGYYVNPNNGALVANASHMTSDYTALKSGVKHTVNYHGRLAFYADKNLESFVSGLDFSSTNPPITFTTPANAKYARYSVNSTSALETLQIEEGEMATPYERFYEKIPRSFLDLPEPSIYADPYLGKGGTKDVAVAPFINAVEANTRVDVAPIELDGEVKKISFRSSKSGSIKIKFFSLADNTFTLEDEVILNAEAGLRTYEAGEDFPSLYAEIGWFVGFYSDANAPKLPFVAGAGINSYVFANVDVTGSVPINMTTTYNIAISVVVEQTIANLASKIEGLGQGGTVKTMEPERLLLDEDFKGISLPNGFTDNGFTINKGATYTGVGGLDKQLIWTKDSTLNTSKTRVWFTPTTTSADLAIVRKHPLNAGLGSIFRLNGAEQKLIMYAPWVQSSSTLPAIATEATLAMPIVANRQYLFELERQTVSKHILKITDTITGESQELVNDFVDTRVFSVGNGYVGVMSFGGDFTINKMQYTSNEPTKPRIAFYGDSFIEAATLILDGGVQLRYADLVKDKLSGSAHINGRGGDRSADLINKLSGDFMTERADYVVLAIGTNDTVFNTWLTNIEKLIEAVEAKGSIPILVTLTKITSSDRTAFMTQINSWIISSGYLYVDANLATTLNNDRQTQNTSLFKADGVHPNVAGHEVIYRRFILDVPEVFDGY